MAEVINTFLDNEILTDQNSQTHLLDFDEESDNSTNSIEPSLYYTMTNFINKIDTDTCTIMSLNCQSLNAKFSNIKLMLDVFAEFNKPIQVLCLQETWFENSDLIDMVNSILMIIMYSMCSLAVSTQDSPAVEPRSNPGSGKILMSENLRLYTTSPVVMC